MASEQRPLVLRGYVVGQGSQWHAICLDLDISADGRTQQEARQTLDAMIRDYLETVASLPPADRARLLARMAPFWTRIGYDLGFLLSLWFQNARGKDRLAFVEHLSRATLAHASPV